MSTFKYIKLTNSLNNTIELFIKAIGVMSGQKIDEYFGIKPDEKIVPLVFCDSYERLLQDGVTCPREFVIERSDFYYQEVGGKPISGFTMLKSRLQYLEKHDAEVSVNVVSLRDWFAGLFRRYCCQDEHVHGSSNLLDLSHDNCVTTCRKWFGAVFAGDTTEAEKKSIGVFWNRFEALPSGMTAIPDYLGAYKDLILKSLFHDEFEMVKSSIIDYRNYMEAAGGRYENSAVVVEKIIFRNNCFCFVHRIERALPRTKGLELKFNAPTLKFNILVLDDNPNAAWNKLGKDASLCDVFDFDCRKLKACRTGGKFAIGTINNLKMIRECSHPRSYDFALLDLSLGESAGDDLMGYHAISFLHQVFPQMPIMIYSRFSDMGHIARAFRCGAKWFLKKGEESKLPRHAHSVMRRIEWQKEWQLISSGLWDWESERLETSRQRAFDDRFKASKEWQYLTYKCLEKYPGKLVVVCPLGGGLSTAVTFRAVKGRRAGHPLQMPVIVKIDNVFNTRLEYERYFRFVRPYIANQSGRIEEPERVLDDDNAAIVYTFAGRQHARYELMLMKDMIGRDVKNRSSCSFESYEKAFDILFEEILSRIHAVKPSHEFDAINSQGEGLSDFPNRSFGEVNVDVSNITQNDFLANWLCRMPIGRELNGPQFISQGWAGDDNPCYEFHRKGTVDGRCVIEASDFEDKCTIVMTGANVDHVVRYRPHTYPCMTLWVDREANRDEIILESAIPEMVKQAIEKLHGSKEIEQYRASNEFAEILKRLMKEPLSAGRPSDDFYKIHGASGVENKDDEKVGNSISWEGAFLEIDNKEKTAFNALPSLFRAAKELLNGTLAKKIMACPAGIVHGDLNYANIMLETKKRLSNDSVFTTDIPDVKDVWLIDFARTRRDLVAHDFNVLFTSTLGLLFDLDVWRSEETIAHDIYYRSMRQFWGERAKGNDTISYNRFIETIFRPFVVKAVFDKLDAVPDGMEHDNRLVLIFKILRRIRAAALKAGMTEESYAFTTALACMVASRVYIVHEENAPAAAAMIATAFICLAKLRRMEMEAGK